MSKTHVTDPCDSTLKTKISYKHNDVNTTTDSYKFFCAGDLN